MGIFRLRQNSVTLAGMTNPNSDGLSEGAKKEVRRVRAVLHADGTLVVELLNRYGKVRGEAKTTGIKSWDAAQNWIGLAMDAQDLVYRNWKLIEDSVTYEAEAGQADPRFKQMEAR